MKSRKTAYIITGLLTLVIGLLGFGGISSCSSRKFTAVMRDGTTGPGLGPSGKGINMSVTGWLSSDGIRVDEKSLSYPSSEDARRDFEVEGRQIEPITGQAESRSSTRFVGKHGSTFKVITLEGNRLHYVQGPTLEAVLNFEASWLKFEWVL